ncbi:hypothetical protein B7G68_04420 [Caulobacter segnis]|uniref:Uncharacterized protein n=1 Tax=Caulobacter segnis TaxID=88688 RepID=A0ABN5ISC6_9CAUL|nr:hypothetical protein B7G68_04420 [Caulobacter segnis]
MFPPSFPAPSVIPALVAGTPGSADTRDASGPPAVRPSRPCGGERGSRHKGGNDGDLWVMSELCPPTSPN